MSKTLITGGCGFIGSNLAHSLCVKGNEVVLFDNLSRKGSEKNMSWLLGTHKNNLQFIRGDIRDINSLEDTVNMHDYKSVYHTAAQVAVTTSVVDPRKDFEINALGTFNVLEAIRKSNSDPAVIFTSTNKVYGGMEDVKIGENDEKYEYQDYPNGIDETYCLDFHSPYGCSKGAADQYVRDYATIYEMKTVVLRMSCQYGIRQFGNEDQGWVVHFIIASVFGKDINIYGDGKQVRDILFIDDLVSVFEKVTENIDDLKGQTFNIGGGKENVISLLELVSYLEEIKGEKINIKFDEWRPGDQPVFVTNISKAQSFLNWSPSISKREGIKKLYNWVKENRHYWEMCK